MSKTTRLLIARHGNTFGPGDTVKRVGITDLPLVDSGILQAQRLGAYLEREDLVPDVIFTSKLKRTLQTAEELQRRIRTNIPVESLSIFNEIDYGPDENQPEEQVLARIGGEALRAWETNATVPNGWNIDPQEIIKNWVDFSLRLTREFSGQTILVVTSNGIARFAPCLTGDFSGFAAQCDIKISTGALCIFEKETGSSVWTCTEWNIKPISDV